MFKPSLLAIAPVTALLAASAASAQNYAGHCSQCQTTYGPGQSKAFEEVYYDNQMWPRQYVWPSRRAICQAYELTVANGWRRNNLLGKYDFSTEGPGLSEAGKIRIERILAYAPPQRRILYVERGVDAAQTAERIEAVQTLAANVNPNAGAVDVQETQIHDEGRPAAAVDAVFTGFGANQPAPVLPSSNSTSSEEGS
jgi:hypothetical protein